jgi:hypothetical protein
MKLPAVLLRRLHWINLPGALLVALLQRTPVLRVMSTVGEIIQAAPMGHVLRSTVAATATLGAMHSLAGATQFVQNPSGTIRGTVGQTVSVGFTIVGSPLPPNEYFVDDLPPGLRTIPASQGGRVPSGSPVISGIPTQAGTFSISVTGSDGTFSQTDTITFIIAPGNLAPAITSQPGNQSVNVGGTATFSVTATGSPTPTYQWRKDTNPIAGATGATLTLTNVALSAAGSYSVVVTNSAGNVTSDVATLTVAETTSAPSITTQPVNQTAAAGGTASFTVVATGTPAPNYQWLKNTTPIGGATNATLSLSNVQNSDAANYAVTVSNSAGSVTSSTVTLTINATSTPPVIVSQPPASIALSAGQSLVLNVGATGAGLTYQWRRVLTGGATPVPLAGETNSTLNIKTLVVADAGLYTCVVTNGSGTATTVGTALFVAATAPANPGHIVNLSVLTSLNSAGDNFSLGYVVNGASAGNSKSLVIRAAGPALATFGVAGTLADPKVELFAGSTKTGENDDWGGVAATASAMASVGAFPYTIPTSRDAAIVTNITGRDNSVKVSAGASASNGTGVVIAEVYEIPDAGGVVVAPRPRLINVSVLKNVGAVLTMGFVVGGDTGKTLLIRAVGPSLTPLGVGGAMADPKLELFDSGGKSLATNDNWGGTTSLSAAFTGTGAFGLTETSKDAAILATLPPGNFTAQVTVATGSTGVALVEVYDVP